MTPEEEAGAALELDALDTGIAPERITRFMEIISEEGEQILIRTANRLEEEGYSNDEIVLLIGSMMNTMFSNETVQEVAKSGIALK